MRTNETPVYAERFKEAPTKFIETTLNSFWDKPRKHEDNVRRFHRTATELTEQETGMIVCSDVREIAHMLKPIANLNTPAQTATITEESAANYMPGPESVDSVHGFLELGFREVGGANPLTRIKPTRCTIYTVEKSPYLDCIVIDYKGINFKEHISGLHILENLDLDSETIITKEEDQRGIKFFATYTKPGKMVIHPLGSFYNSSETPHYNLMRANLRHYGSESRILQHVRQMIENKGN